LSHELHSREYPGLREPKVSFQDSENMVYALASNNDESVAQDGERQPEQKVWQPDEMLREVHGGRKLHFGARRTWLALGKRFPGHKLPFRWVAEWISKCPVCQKDRLGMENYLEPMYRHIKQERSQKAVGVDRLTVIPADAEGNTCLIVIVEFLTKYVWATPAKEYTANTIAVALLRTSALLECLKSYGLIQVRISCLKWFRSSVIGWESGE